MFAKSSETFKDAISSAPLTARTLLFVAADASMRYHACDMQNARAFVFLLYRFNAQAVRWAKYSIAPGNCQDTFA